MFENWRLNKYYKSKKKLVFKNRAGNKTKNSQTQINQKFRGLKAL